MAATTRRREASFWPRAAKTKGPSASGSRISRPPVLKDWTTHPLSPSTCQRLQHLANGTSTCPESFFFATRSTAFSNSRPRKDHVAEVDGVPPGFLCPARGAARTDLIHQLQQAETALRGRFPRLAYQTQQFLLAARRTAENSRDPSTASDLSEAAETADVPHRGPSHTG